MRSAALSSRGRTTSSRQSPNRSPDSDGVDLVPLMECAPEPVSRRVSPLVPYLSTWLPSSSSRTGSASHQARKFALAGARPTLPPEELNALVRPVPLPQNSAPGLPAYTSPATPRAGPSQPQVLFFCMITAPLLASRRVAAAPELCSWICQISSPGRLGTKSPTCNASP